jgi:uncharacterized protein
MSEQTPEPIPEPAPIPTTWEPLSPLERRVLGVLIEKQKTSKTSDAYPMTLNSLTTGCNQKSNREPVMDLDEEVVEETLLSLNKKVLVNKVQGGRVEKWRHLLYDLWKVSQVEMAILAELLLRGPQSEGDLRSRASRMNDIADLETLRGLLNALKDRNFVVYLTAAGRGAVVSHGFHTMEELELEQERKRNSGGAVDVVRAEPARTPSPALEAKLADALAQIAELKQRVTQLEAWANAAHSASIPQTEPGALADFQNHSDSALTVE